MVPKHVGVYIRHKWCIIRVPLLGILIMRNRGLIPIRGKINILVRDQQGTEHGHYSIT